MDLSQNLKSSLQTLSPKPCRLIPGAIEKVSRLEPCRMCQGTKAYIIARVDYWDLLSSQLVECTGCATAQLDPMPKSTDMSLGCQAYYFHEAFRLSEKEQKRNALRNYRRGVAFGARLLKRNIHPQQVLEIGSGDGHFLKGLQYVFPNIQCTILDIVEEVLEYNSKHFGYRPVKGEVETHPGFNTGFDLIIARDVMEHLENPLKAILNISQWLKPKGYFHFITPNGREDAWRFFCLEKLHNSPGELLINHVNYFCAPTLKDFLELSGNLKSVDYFIYGFKEYSRGWGKVISEKYAAPKSNRRSAKNIIEKHQGLTPPSRQSELGILESSALKPLVKAYSCYKDSLLLKGSPERQIGHEIYGVFQKS